MSSASTYLMKQVAWVVELAAAVLGSLVPPCAVCMFLLWLSGLHAVNAVI